MLTMVCGCWPEEEELEVDGVAVSGMKGPPEEEVVVEGEGWPVVVVLLLLLPPSSLLPLPLPLFVGMPGTGLSRRAMASFRVWALCGSSSCGTGWARRARCSCSRSNRCCRAAFLS